MIISDVPFSWSVINKDVPDVTDFSVRRNFDDSEMKAYASGGALRNLIYQLDNAGYSVDLYAHSLGNIVASEALRLEAISPGHHAIVHTYVASQAAVSAAAYDPNVASAPQNLLPTLAAHQLINPTPDIYTNFPVTNKAYFEQIGLATDKAYNFYNPEDGAVAAPAVWPGNQTLKPGLAISTGVPNLTYAYNAATGIFSEALTNYTYAQIFGSAPSSGPIWVKNLSLANQYDAYAVMSFAAGSWTKGLGALGGVKYSFTTAGEVNLQKDFSDPTNLFTDSRDDHSGQFNLDNPQRKMYWNVLMKRFGLKPITDWTKNLGDRP